MKIRLTGALALAVLAISAPLALAGGEDVIEVADRVEICHITGPDTVESLDVSPDVLITVSTRAVPAHEVLHADKSAGTCDVLDVAKLIGGGKVVGPE